MKSNHPCRPSPLKDIAHPYGLASEIACGVKFDLAIIKQNNGNHTVVKIVNLQEKAKVERVRNLCHGKIYMVNWQGDTRARKKCVHYIFERLGGFQCRQHVFRMVEDGKPKAERSEEEWDAGFNFKESDGPRDHTKNRHLRWITVQTTSKDSPIYKWPPILVEKSLRNLSQDNILAQVHNEWPLTLFDVDVRLLKALAPIFPTLSEKALGFHGLAGAGKAPVARSIAMALSRRFSPASAKLVCSISFVDKLVRCLICSVF